METSPCIKMQVCNLEGTGNSDSGVSVPVLLWHDLNVSPASLEDLYNLALNPPPHFHGCLTYPAGVWNCLFVIQPHAPFAVKIY